MDWLLGGGKGLAKGFGGPVAPALNILDALGEGGGRTTPDWLASLPVRRPGVSPEVLVIAAPGARCVDVGAELRPPPSSDTSLGMCTFRRGLFEASAAKDMECCVRWGCENWGEGLADAVGFDAWEWAGPGVLICAPDRWRLAISTERDRSSGSCLMFSCGESTAPMPHDAASIDRLSSMGVNMLRDLTGRG